MVGGVLIFFVLIFGTFFAIHAFSATTERANVTAEYEPALNTSIAVSEGGIGFLQLLMWVVICFLVAVLGVALLRLMPKRW
jgi:hypothetical protein